MSTPSVTQLVGEDALPLVSIIICSFNHAHYLAEAIDSALHQSHPLIEVVVVDDGSVDETPQVAASFPGVTYLHQQNFGLANARNRGLRACKGSFVVFIDADDRLLPGDCHWPRCSDASINLRLRGWRVSPDRWEGRRVINSARRKDSCFRIC